MKDFSVVAGEKGLNRVIETTEILDFEFTSEGEAYRKSSFEGKASCFRCFSSPRIGRNSFWRP